VHDLGRARRFLPGPRLVSVLVGGAAAILVLYPVVFLVQASLSTGDPQARPPEAYGLDNFTDLPRYGHIFANTVIVAVAATAMAVALGFTMGWILSRTNVPGRGALEQLMALPYYVTPLMGALAWSLLGSPSGGFVNQLWRAVGGDGHLIDVTTPYGIAWVMALFEGSVAFVMIGAVMKSMDPSLEEASQVLGAGRLRTMLRITLPLVLPGLASGAVLSFARSLGEFGATIVVAGGIPRQTQTLSVAIFNLTEAGREGDASVLMLVSIFVAFAVWQFLSTVVFNPFLIPPPLVVFKTMVPMVENGEIFKHVAISLARVGVGFVLGCILAVVLGVILGRVRLVNDLLDPIIELLRYLSPTAMIPIAVIWFGIGETSKYFLIFWGTFFIVLINTTAGVMRAPVIRQRAAECLGASRMEIFALVVIPSAAPYIVTGMRIAMASSFMSIIPAEILAADSGIGFLLQQSSVLLQTNRIFVALLTICVLGFVSDRLFRIAVDRMLSRYMSYISLT